MPFNIPNPQGQLSQINKELEDRYSIGKKSNNLSEIKNLKPIFAFDYLSFQKTKLCFNSKYIDAKKDYSKFLLCLKKISGKTFDELSKDKTFHFHDVDFKDTKVSEREFLRCLVSDVSNIDDSSIPTVFQFKAFKEARIFGFCYKCGFYPVWFDRNHEVYKRK
jgi:hypothetical protein